MNYKNIGVWVKGYVDAIQDGQSITRLQLNKLVDTIQSMIIKIEEEANNSKLGVDDLAKQEVEQEDDLPF